MELDDTTEGIRIGAAKYGQGVFATKSYVPGEAIGQVQGHVIHDPHHDSDYCIELFDDYSLEPEAPFRYVNHSCSPNCQFVQYEIEHEGEIVAAQIWLETIRPIASTEQLTIDYAWPVSEAIPCECESDDCRGWIVAEAELNRLLLVEPAPRENEDEAAVNAA